MKYSTTYLLIVLCASLIITSGCSKEYLNVNNDPNRVTDENITPDLIFVQAATNAGFRYYGAQPGAEGATTDLQFIEDWMGYMAGSGDFVPNASENTYNLDFTFGDNLWQSNYALLFDLHQVKTKALAAGDSALAGASMILSAKVFQEIADTYGNLPYSQAFDVFAYPHPVYDKAEDVYKDLLLSLDTAITYMIPAAPLSFTATDIINHGNQARWIKFANTLKLRLLLRQSNVAGFDPSAEIAKIHASLGVLKQGETVSVNPGFTNEQNKQSPFYGNYGYKANGNISAQGYVANDYIISLLLSTQDDRISRFFSLPTAGGNYTGSIYGATTGNPIHAQASYFGPGLLKSAAQDQWLYPSFESMFLEAEAIARGWITWDGTAQQAYEAAVTESFTWLGVPDAETAAADYMANNDVANWANAGSSVDAQAKFIVYQKYISLCCIDPVESWADVRRLDFLTDASYISVNPARVSDKLPLRLPYPQSEYTTNAASVLSEGTINILTSKLFWEK